MTSARPGPAPPHGGRWPIQVSRLAYALTFALAMATPTWKKGAFTRLPILALRLGGQRFQLGALALLPALALGAWGIGRLLERPRRRWRWGPAYVALPVFGFGAWTLARVWPVHVPHTALVTVVAIAVFWSAYLYALQEWPARWAVGSLAALLAVQGAIAALQFAVQGPVGLSWMGEGPIDPQGQGISVIEAGGRRWLRAYGLMPHPNVLGGYLSMSLLVCLGAARSVPRRLRPWLGACIGLGGLGLLVTFSRSAWLGTLAGLAYLVAVARPWRGVNWRSRRARWTLALLGALLLVGALAVATLFGDLLVARLFRLGEPLEERSIQDRAHDAREAWSLIRAVPLKGTGPGYYLGALWAGVGEDRPPGFRKVHNVLLLTAAELGLVGALLWLWMSLAPPIALARRARRAGYPAGRAGWAAAFVSAVGVSMLDQYLYLPSVWWAALYLGLLTGEWARGEVAPRRQEGQG